MKRLNARTPWELTLALVLMDTKKRMAFVKMLTNVGKIRHVKRSTNVLILTAVTSVKK